MKTKTWYIVLIILIIIVIGWLIIKKSNAPMQTTATQTTSTTTDTNTDTSSSDTDAIPTVTLGGGSHGQTTALVVGQKLIVTVIDPTDAGYQVDPLQYDTAILSQTNHTHDASTGVNGSDTWDFTALKSGTTGLTITATQGTNKKTMVTLFTNAISVK